MMIFTTVFKLKPVIFNGRNLIRTKLFSRKYNDVPFEDIPEVSPAIIKQIFKSHNQTFEEGYTCFLTNCVLCRKHAKSTVHNFYVNKTTGMYMCSCCKQHGQWDSLQKYFTNKRKKSKTQTETELVNHAEIIAESLQQIRETTSELHKCDNLDSVMNKFRLPNISTASLENIDVRVDTSLHNLFFPLENVDSEIVGYNKFHYKDSITTIPNYNYGGLITGKPPKNRDSAILVPNIADLLVLLNAKVGYNIVCLPNGVSNLSPYFLPSLERYNKLILWFGNDLKSWDSARHFAKKLGEKRCLFIRPSEKVSSPQLVPPSEIKNIVSTAQPIWHKSITTFSSLREDVLANLRNIDKVDGIKWRRYPTLNKILKGHRRGELTVITGPTGSGKTTFISDYSLDLAMQGVNTLWGSFEIRNERLARTMLQQFSGLALEEHLDEFDSWADRFEQLPIYFMTFHGQQSIKVVMEAVEHATYVHDIAHIVIDNVQFMMGMTENERHMDRFWKQDAIIASFRTFATRKNCHITLVIHPRKEREDDDLTTSSIFGGAKASQEADNVLIIQDKRLTSTRGKKYLQVAKNRYSGDLGVMALDFDKSSLSYYQKRKVEKKTTLDNVEIKATQYLVVLFEFGASRDRKMAPFKQLN